MAAHLSITAVEKFAPTDLGACRIVKSCATRDQHLALASNRDLPILNRIHQGVHPSMRTIHGADTTARVKRRRNKRILTGLSSRCIETVVDKANKNRGHSPKHCCIPDTRENTFLFDVYTQSNFFPQSAITNPYHPPTKSCDISAS